MCSNNSEANQRPSKFRRGSRRNCKRRSPLLSKSGGGLGLAFASCLSLTQLFFLFVFAGRGQNGDGNDALLNGSGLGRLLGGADDEHAIGFGHELGDDVVDVHIRRQHVAPRELPAHKAVLVLTFIVTAVHDNGVGAHQLDRDLARLEVTDVEPNLELGVVVDDLRDARRTRTSIANNRRLLCDQCRTLLTRRAMP
ncbi:unnamed protein product [Ixodes pacificus]